jgi:hypothetical protein
MRLVLLTFVFLGLLAGCGRQPPPPAGANAALADNELTTVSAEGDWQAPPASGPSSYQGRSVVQWAKQLQTDNHAERSQASMALGQMGEAGYPHLLAGIKSNSDARRIVCLQAMSRPVMLTHGHEMVALLTRMLRDREPMIRRSAAARLPWFGAGAQGALRDLRIMVESDPVPDIRQVAQVSIELIMNPDKPPPREPNPKGN